MKFQHKKITINDNKEIINVSFRIPKQEYEKIRTLDMVQDFALAILAEIESKLKENIQLDSPDLDAVDIQEKYDN